MSVFEASSDFKVNAKLYARKELVMMDTSIMDFNQHLYINEIQNLTFKLPRVNILVTHPLRHSRVVQLNNIVFMVIL